MGRFTPFLLLIVVIPFLLGCSGGGGDVAVVPGVERPALSEDTGRMLCLGFWQVKVDKSGSVEVVDMRGADLVVNVLQFMEPPPMSKLKIKFNTLVIDGPNKRIEVDVVLNHPFPFAKYRGFDVRGVVFGPRVGNADGLTVIPSPEFFSSVMFGYKDGLLGVPDAVANFEGLAGYKYFCDGLGANDKLATFMSNPANLAKRGTFSPGAILSRHYVLEWLGSGYNFMVFNYAIYANYGSPVPPAPFTIDSFPVETANSQEAICLKSSELTNTLAYNTDSGTGSGTLGLEVEIWDWQGNDDEVVIGVLDDYPFPADAKLTYIGPGSGLNSKKYRIDGYVPNMTSPGDLDLLIIVFDEKTFGQSWFANKLQAANPLYSSKIFNCFIHTVNVEDGTPPDYFTIPYDDPMDTTTQDRWSVEKLYGSHTAPNADWYQEGTQWICNDPLTGMYENVMTTWLISPPLMIPDEGEIQAFITYKYDTQPGLDLLHVGLDLIGDGKQWNFFSNKAGGPVSGNLSGQNPSYPDYDTSTNWYFSKGLAPGQIVRLGFIFATNTTVSNYAGAFVDHVTIDIPD